jgi:hypothetical protein
MEDPVQVDIAVPINPCFSVLVAKAHELDVDFQAMFEHGLDELQANLDEHDLCSEPCCFPPQVFFDMFGVSVHVSPEQLRRLRKLTKRLNLLRVFRAIGLPATSDTTATLAIVYGVKYHLILTPNFHDAVPDARFLAEIWHFAHDEDWADFEPKTQN